jgi:hypothetical protein
MLRAICGAICPVLSHALKWYKMMRATLDKVEPCKPPIRRRPTDTTRQFIERAMRENHGYTIPARWLADLDAIPDGDTGEPESGYLVGVDTSTDPTLLEPLPPKPRTPGHG